MAGSGSGGGSGNGVGNGGTSAPASDAAPSPVHELDKEFGAITGTEVRFHERVASSDSEAEVMAVGKETGQPANQRFSKAQWRRLRNHIWHPRWLRQYFPEQGVLVREKDARKPSNEELYLDLILVAAIASLSHQLRHDFHGWSSVENFMLLFAALYSSWRTLMFLWNAFGTKGVRFSSRNRRCRRRETFD
jgi:hypothetical protein